MRTSDQGDEVIVPDLRRKRWQRRGADRSLRRAQSENGAAFVAGAGHEAFRLRRRRNAADIAHATGADECAGDDVPESDAVAVRASGGEDVAGAVDGDRAD